MKFKTYIKEENKLSPQRIKKIKADIKELKASLEKGKLKPSGKKKLEQLEDSLFAQGIFDF